MLRRSNEHARVVLSERCPLAEMLPSCGEVVSCEEVVLSRPRAFSHGEIQSTQRQ